MQRRAADISSNDWVISASIRTRLPANRCSTGRWRCGIPGPGSKRPSGAGGKRDDRLMIILGIGGILGDAASAILKDGRLAAAVEESKLSRQGLKPGAHAGPTELPEQS